MSSVGPVDGDLLVHVIRTEDQWADCLWRGLRGFDVNRRLSVLSPGALWERCVGCPIGPIH